MSRIGKNPIVIPDNVEFSTVKNDVKVKGPKGELNLELRPEISVEKKDGFIVVNRNGEAKNFKAMHGLYRMLINNMVIGVSKGYEKRLNIIGTGYKASADPKKVTLNIGYSYPYTYDIPQGIKVTVENNTTLIIEGIDKQLVGQVAADIRKMRPPEPYKGKGIKYSDEIIKRKAGKSTK